MTDFIFLGLFLLVSIFIRFFSSIEVAVISMLALWIPLLLLDKIRKIQRLIDKKSGRYVFVALSSLFSCLFMLSLLFSFLVLLFGVHGSQKDRDLFLQAVLVGFIILLYFTLPLIVPLVLCFVALRFLGAKSHWKLYTSVAYFLAVFVAGIGTNLLILAGMMAQGIKTTQIGYESVFKVLTTLPLPILNPLLIKAIAFLILLYLINYLYAAMNSSQRKNAKYEITLISLIIFFILNILIDLVNSPIFQFISHLILR